MLNPTENGEVREVVGVFDDPKQLDAAVAELEVTAFPRPDISVLNSRKELENLPDHAARSEWLADSPDAPRGVSVRPEEKTIGAGVLIGCFAYVFGCGAAILTNAESSASLLAAITGGSLFGAAIGALILFGISYKIKNRTAQQINKGGLLLWVRTPDSQKEKLAQDILRKHGGKRVHIHSIS